MCELMVSVTWGFDTAPFQSLIFDFDVLTEPDNNDGLYLQFYEGYINGVLSYFGIQTDIIQPGHGFVGKGFLFSRWKTRDLSNARPNSGGWTESSGHEDDFIGIRCRYNWTTHRYRLTIRYSESDDIGDWYCVMLEDLKDGTNEFMGSLRYPKVNSEITGIADGGTTWIELYSPRNEKMANWHIRINNAYANEENAPKKITSDWSENVVYINRDKAVHLIQSDIGKKVPVRRIPVD